MKSSEINSKWILIIASIILAIFGLVTNGFPADIRIIQGGLYVDGEPFIIKGVNYSAVPIGIDPEITPPYGDYFTAQHSPIYERDLPLLREMGVNTIRLRGWNKDADHNDFLNKAYNNGIRPIYIVLTFPIDPGLYADIASPATRKKIKADFRAMVKAHKYHPAILMWSIGDELNSSKMYGGRLKEIFSLINEMASEAHAEEGAHYHPVTTALVDIDLVNTINAYELLTPGLDIWGANVYRGASFGELFNDFKKVSTKPLLITGFGIDAYDENSGEEYENIGEPYQATYADSLWKEVQANQDVCLGGIIKSFSDEWWLGKFGNTLEGCPDLNPSLHSPCGHPSTSDPDGFVNDEWFGMMRVKKNGSNLDILEARKVYTALKSLWTVEKIAPQLLPRASIPQVLPSVKPLDLTRVPTTEEIMAAGQLGGQLYATRETGESAREKRINLSFGEAIEAWNNHEYKQAVKLFKKHIDDYPDSPWASEAVLHIGCDAQYNGRYTEAEKSFKWILEKNKDEAYEGAKRLVNKARLRLGVLKVYQNNFKEAREYFTVLKKEGSGWRDRTYASHWIQRLSRYSANKLAMLNCGTQAIAHLLEKDGRGGDARRVLEELPETEPGHSIKTLSEIASRYGYSLSAIRVSPSELKDLPLPAMMHINGKNEGDSGHYWVLEKVNEGKIELFDPQAGLRFEQSYDEFLNEWSGNALVFSDKQDLPGIRLAENEMEELYGGCCGVPAAEAQLGDSCWRYSGPGTGNNSPYGSPYWKVNMVNMNLYVNDIPLWYRSKIGPSVYISLSYSSQSAIAYNEPFGNKWMFNYGSFLVVDTAGNVTVFMPDGKRHVYTKTTDGYKPPYQVFNTLTKILGNHYQLKFPNGVVYVYNIPPGTRSQQPFLVEMRDRYGRKLTFGYDSNVRLTKITDALKRVTTLTYNDQGLATLVKDPFGRQATFEYDESRNLVRMTDMAGHSSTLSYDEDVYLTGIENQRGKYEFYIEPADGVSGSGVYPAPGAIMWENYRITITNPIGNKEEYYYWGDSGAYSWYVSPKHYLPYSSTTNNYTNAAKTYYYLTNVSGNGEIGKITDPEGVSVSFIYDTAGNRIGIKDGKGNALSLTYDPTGKVLTITDPLGNQLQLFYDNRNNLTHLIDPEGNDYYLDYSGYDLMRIRDPKKGATRFTYTIYDQLKSLVDAKDHSTKFDYDNLGNLESVTNPLGGQEIYGYDDIGRVISYTDSKGNETSYKRDELGRITEVKYQDGGIKTYTYDCCRLTTVTDSNGTMTFSYDALKRLSSSSDVYGNNIYYSYDKNGNLITLTYPDGKVVIYESDKADRLIKVKDWLNSVTTYGYDSLGNLVKTSYPDGSAITYQYDNAYGLKSIVDMNSDGVLNALYKYELDSFGNRKTISFYQPMNAIPSWPNTSYTYDKENRLLTAGGAAFGYDDNGNLIKKTSGNDITEYGWNHNDMLSGLVHGGDVYSYFYDGLGSRIAKIEKSSETRYVVTPGLLSTILAETNAGGEITDYYVYGMGLISKVNSSGESYYYHYDGIGSTVGMSDSSGNIVNRYAYDAFGKVLNQEETIPNPFKYVGQFGVMDEGNGLLFMRARYYDPEVGRFINKDPIGLFGGLNMYAYVANNPINWVDPLGLEAEPCSLGTKEQMAGVENFPSLPSLTARFPNSNIVAPTADLIIGGLEGGFAIGMMGAAVGAFIAGPETWVITATLGPAGIYLGGDAFSRMSDAIQRLRIYNAMN